MEKAKIILFEHANFGGRSLIVESAEPNLQTRQFNDKTTSAIVISGVWAIYQHTNYGGKTWTVSEVGGPNDDGTYTNRSDWNGKNDAISSLKPFKPS